MKSLVLFNHVDQIVNGMPNTTRLCKYINLLECISVFFLIFGHYKGSPAKIGFLQFLCQPIPRMIRCLLYIFVYMVPSEMMNYLSQHCGLLYIGWLMEWLTSSDQSATGTVDIQVTMPTDKSAIIHHTPGDTLFRFKQWRSKGGTWNTTATPWVL